MDIVFIERRNKLVLLERGIGLDGCPKCHIVEQNQRFPFLDASKVPCHC